MIPERGLDLSDVDRAVWWITLSSRVEYSFSTLNAAKLKILEVGLSNVRAESGTNTTRPLDLSSCRSLSQLTFSDQGSLYGPTSCNSSWIAATLSSLPLRHRIQNLVIRSSVAPSLQSLSPALSRLHSHSDDVKVSIQVPGLRDTVDDYQRERVARLKDQIYNLVKWEGCESVLQVRDWS
ncbi:hypothetical protein BDN72DRAFT_435629 [Pluteus cervinus]|uniref:Uncharacterized protein n=1 Tax=Pluteus cervinus TaxID=181527 RepID=A0ACD3A7M3_9AGAR|nr:hypothetical protein BDN72DRAFT_435629 [Pluteus cervinus]